MLVSEAKVRIVFQSMNKVADFVKSGFTYYYRSEGVSTEKREPFRKRASLLQDAGVCSGKCQCLFGAKQGSPEHEATVLKGWKATGLETPEGRDTKKEEASRASSSMAF